MIKTINILFVNLTVGAAVKAMGKAHGDFFPDWAMTGQPGGLSSKVHDGWGSKALRSAKDTSHEGTS